MSSQFPSGVMFWKRKILVDIADLNAFAISPRNQNHMLSQSTNFPLPDQIAATLEWLQGRLATIHVADEGWAQIFAVSINVKSPNHEPSEN